MEERSTGGRWFYVSWLFRTRFVRPRRPIPSLAEAIIAALAELEMAALGQIGAFVVMPDHLRALVKPTGLPLRRLLVALRRSVEAHMLDRGRHRKPLAKQYYPREIAKEELVRVARAIINRPVARGLTDLPHDWPYSSAHPEVASLFCHLIHVLDEAEERSNSCHEKGIATASRADEGRVQEAELGERGLGGDRPRLSRQRLDGGQRLIEPCPEGASGQRMGARTHTGYNGGARGQGEDGLTHARPALTLPARAKPGAKRVHRQDSLEMRVRRWVRELWRWLRLRLLPWEPDWQPRAEEVRAEFPERGRRARQGRRAEEFVARWLWLRGHRILARNVRCTHGEIDIVARKRKSLIAVEVRSYVEGGERPSDWLGYGKRRSIWRSIMRFQELRERTLGHLEVQAVLAEVQFSSNGRIKAVTLYPLPQLHKSAVHK